MKPLHLFFLTLHDDPSLQTPHQQPSSLSSTQNSIEDGTIVGNDMAAKTNNDARSTGIQLRLLINFRGRSPTVLQSTLQKHRFASCQWFISAPTVSTYPRADTRSHKWHRTCGSSFVAWMAGGFSGHRHGHLKSALRHEGLRADLLSVVADVVNVINRGRILLELVLYTHGGFGNIAGKKRLFVVMESLVRISDTVLQSKFLKDKGAKTLFKYNLGVGIPAAADVLASWLEKVLAEHRMW